MKTAQEVGALKPVLDAMRRGTRRSRLRTLVVVCPGVAGHTLLEVFPTVEGPVALWSSRERWERVAGGEPIKLDAPALVWRAQHVADGGSAPWPHCRCTESALIDFEWVAEQLAAGVRRAVVPL